MKKLCYISILLILITSGFAIESATTDFVQNTAPVEISQNVRRLDYQIVWSLTINHVGALGVTPVWDTMLWVSSGGRTSSADPNWMLIYNLNTRILVDSFLQGTPETWGYRDMCFYNGYVYAGYEGYVDKIDPASHQIAGHYAITTPNPVRALMDNDVEDSLWSATFTAPIYKFWNQGGTSRQVAPAQWALYGLAYDAHGYVWGSAQNPMSTLVKYNYPNFTTLDTATISEIVNPLGDSAIAGGCEMWRDSFLLYLGQAKPLDKVYCMKLTPPPPPPAKDVGVMAIRQPSLHHTPNTPMTVIATIKNFGLATQTSFPVVCSVVGSGIVRHTNTQTIATLAPGDTSLVTFTSFTPTIEERETIIVRTNLPQDSNPANDRMIQITNVTNSIEIIIGTGTTNTYLYPMYCGQVYSVAEDIYLQSEIGYYGRIMNLAYSKASGTALNTIESVAIFMKHTTEDTLITGSWDTTGYTRVYSGPFPNTATTGWMEITLDTPFLYNNVDNLKILILKGPPSFTSYPYWHYTTTTPAYRNRYGYGATLPASLTRTVVRPNIRFALTPSLRPQRDVGVRAILNIGSWQFPNTPMTPQARIMNYGSASQTFGVICSIVNMTGTTRHVNTQTISLASLIDTIVTFTSWTPTILETLNVNVRTNLINDTNPSNDRMTQTTRITNIAEIIIGTGTSASGTYLMYGYDAYAGSEAIYLQSEIGYYGNITNLAYYKGGGTGLDPTPDVRIYMKHTTETSIATGAYDTTGYTLVFADSFPNNAASGWMDVRLQTPFLYNNQDNLGILILKGPPALASGVYPTYRYTTTSPTYLNRYGYNNTGWPIASFTQTYYRMNIRFYLSPVTPPARDVGVEQIIAPISVHQVNTPLIPIARVKNYGSQAQSFAVGCSIIGPGHVVRYANTQNVTNLAVGDTARVNFASCTPTNAETDTVIMKTLLTNDSVPANDRKSRTTTVGNVMLQDFEASNGGYVADPATGGWEWGVPTSGPMTAHSGTKVWATLLGANYTASANWKLTSVDFVANVDNPVLMFWHWYDTEVAYDGGNVKISTDHGVTFTLITPVGGYTGTANSSNVGIPLEPCFTGHVQGFWEEEVFVLPVDSGQTFMIRWHFGSDASVFYPGWYIDDVVGVNFAWTGITEENTNTITRTALYAPKPNPVANGMAHISFMIATPSKTSLKVYNASGRLIKTLVNEKLTNGTYNYIWNGTDNNSREVADGIYFYTLTTDNNNFTKKLVFTR